MFVFFYWVFFFSLSCSGVSASANVSSFFCRHLCLLCLSFLLFCWVFFYVFSSSLSTFLSSIFLPLTSFISFPLTLYFCDVRGKAACVTTTVSTICQIPFDSLNPTRDYFSSIRQSITPSIRMHTVSARGDVFFLLIPLHVYYHFPPEMVSWQVSQAWHWEVDVAWLNDIYLGNNIESPPTMSVINIPSS